MPADKPLFGAIGDSAPDRWGRALMRRAERRRAEREGTAPRTVREMDYLLLVDDEAREGALRFAAKVAGYFELKQDQARAIAREVGKAVGSWRKEAAGHGLSKQEIERMSSAFEHDDGKAAVSGKRRLIARRGISRQGM